MSEKCHKRTFEAKEHQSPSHDGVRMRAAAQDVRPSRVGRIPATTYLNVAILPFTPHCLARGWTNLQANRGLRCRKLNGVNICDLRSQLYRSRLVVTGLS